MNTNNVSVSREALSRLLEDIDRANDEDIRDVPFCFPDSATANDIRTLKDALAQPSEQPGDDQPRPRGEPCTDPECGCMDPAFTDPIEALRFLSGRFKYAGVSHPVAKSYARDIDKILDALSPSVPAEAVAWRKAMREIKSLADYFPDEAHSGWDDAVNAAYRISRIATEALAAPPANDEWRAAIVKRLAELGLFAADEQDDPALAVSTLETIAASANDEAVRLAQELNISAVLIPESSGTEYCVPRDKFDALIAFLASQQEEKGNG